MKTNKEARNVLDRTLDRAAYYAVFGAVSGAVYKAVRRAEGGFVQRAVNTAVEREARLR